MRERLWKYGRRLLARWLMFMTVGAAVAEQPATLLFASGFEADVQVDPPKARTLSGADRTSGYRWPADLPGAHDRAYFNYLVSRDKALSEFVETRIETVPGPHGTPTRALYINVLKLDRDFKGTTRVQYNMFPGGESAADRLQQMYVRYWLKLQPNLPDVLTWRLIMEWLNGDYRWGVYIYRDKNDKTKPYWHVKGQYLKKPGRPNHWQVSNKDVPVPLDTWFKFEVFWVHSAGPDGRVWVAIDGQTICDYKGPNKVRNGIGAWCIFKNYGSIGSGQWIDDLALYDRIPGR